MKIVKNNKIKALLFLFCFFTLVITGNAYSQGMYFFDTENSKFDPESDIPEETDPLYVAMVFHKFAGRVPNFREMVMNSEEYQNAPDHEKIYMIENKIDEYRNFYNLITLEEPIILKTEVWLTDYNKKLGGFLIKNFEDGFYIPIYSASKNYAVIPQRIIDKQWMKVPNPEKGKMIEKYSAIGILKRDPIIMSLSLSPAFADMNKPVNIDGTDFLLMSAKVNNMTLYSPDSKKVLWRSDKKETQDENYYGLVKPR